MKMKEVYTNPESEEVIIRTETNFLQSKGDPGKGDPGKGEGFEEIGGPETDNKFND